MKGNLLLLLLHFPRAPISSLPGIPHAALLTLCLCLQRAVPGSTFRRPQGLLQAAVLAAGVSHAPSPANDVCVSMPPTSSSASPSLPVLPSPMPLLPQGHGLGALWSCELPSRPFPRDVNKVHPPLSSMVAVGHVAIEHLKCS